MMLPRDERLLESLIHVATCPDCQLHLMAVALLMETEEVLRDAGTGE